MKARKRESIRMALPLQACAGLLLAAAAVGFPAFAQEGVAPDGTLRPSWETQRLARTYLLAVPAPRGQITDRNGQPLAQTRVGYNLSLQFPAPQDWPDEKAVAFARAQARMVEQILRRPVPVSDDAVAKHYRNRGVLPFDLALDLPMQELELLRRIRLEHLALTPAYLRYYPNGPLAGHAIGYAGRAGKALLRPVQNNDSLWPDLEGREGIEQVFDSQLAGHAGQINLTFDATGKKASERVVVPPQPGHNVITTLDIGIQRLCERVLEKRAKRGAIVVVDAVAGDILALASWPVFDPNLFVPTIDEATFAGLRDDPASPLLPRAFRSAYPAGSTFKVFIGTAALQSGAISPEDEFSCPSAYGVGNLVFRNWKKEDQGSLNFRQALTQSCNTWFYQVGIKTGGRTLSDWAFRFGLGQKTGIALAGEVPGRIPTDDYMRQIYKRPMMDGDVANFSIGQGDILVSPLQMALAMTAAGNGGTVFQPRLVLQVQSVDNRVVAAYGARARSFLSLSESTEETLREAMVDVVSSGSGTAGQASVKGVKVAGKTGTAQWGPKKNERTAAWFAGFAPAESPRYGFAALYEGAPNDDDVHGGSHAAPMIGEVLRELFKEEKKKKAEEAETPDGSDGGDENPPAQAPAGD